MSTPLPAVQLTDITKSFGATVASVMVIDSDWAASWLRFYWFRLSDVMVPAGVAASGICTLRYLDQEEGKVKLVPANMNYQPILVSPDDIVIEGVFVGLIRDSFGV